MFKLKQIKYFAVFIVVMCSCSKEKNNFELKEWLSEMELIETKAIAFQSDCDSLISLMKNLKDEEFKAQVYLLLSKCYIQERDEKNAKKYLKKYLSAGKHISWIDTIYFSSILPSAKEYEQLNGSFWKKRDTFYFSEIEKRVKLDQASIRAYVANPTDKLENKEKEIFKRNSEYLLKITDSVGFPWTPGPNNFEKKRFRVGVIPELIGVHAPIEDKIIHQQNSIEAARKGEISWNIPVVIGVTFFTQRPIGEVMPLRFLQFDSRNRLNLKDSYLQLYSIKKYMQNINLSRIKFQASKENPLEKDIILQQLQDMKKAMVEEFGWPEKAIEISTDPNAAENFQEDQPKGSYAYTFTAF